MNKTWGEQDEKLWDEWKEHYLRLNIDKSRICRDGIVSPEVFGNEKLKLLFVGKEANDWEGGDMRCLGLKHRYSHNLARWAAGFLNGFPDFYEINQSEKLKEALNRISLINLKKTSGGSSSDSNVISAYAKNDRELLLKQIKLIKPNVIIALSIHETLVWLLDLIVPSDSPNKNPYYSESHKLWIVPWWKHPSLRGSVEEPYNQLKEFVNKNPEFVEFLKNK